MTDTTIREVTVARVPGISTRVMITANMTVAEALALAGIEVGRNETIRGNGESVDPNASVNGYSTLTVSANIKGN